PRGKRAQTYKVYCNVIATRKDNGLTKELLAEKDFVITKASQGDSSYLVLTVHDWNYGSSREPATAVALYGAEMGTVTIYYRQEGEGDDDWTTEVPTDAGNYEACAKSSGTDSYPEVTSVTKDFTINKMTLETPADFVMKPDGNGNHYGLLDWSAVSAYKENAGVDSASEVTVTYEIKIYLDETVIGTERTTDTQMDVISYIVNQGRYKFTVQALATDKDTGAISDNINCNDSTDVATINTPIIGATVSTDVEGNTKEYDGTPITLTADYADGSAQYWYKWYKNDVEIEGATESTYQITEVNESDLYSAQVMSTSTSADNEWVSSKAVQVTITQRPVKIEGFSDSKTYDNTALTHAGVYTGDSLNASGVYTISYIGIAYENADALVDGAELTSLTYSGTITGAGTVDNEPAAAVIENAAGDKTDNYAITYVSGSLTVNKKTVTMTAPDDEKVYDGTALTAPGFGYGIADDKKVTISGLLEEHQLSGVSMTETSTRTTYGETDNVIDTDSIVITDINDTSASPVNYAGNYNFVTTSGTLKITKRPITITAGSDTTTYVPNIAFTTDSYALTDGSLADGDEITSVTNTGSLTTVGNCSNISSDAVIQNGNNEDVSDSYDITYVPGTLTVNKGIQVIEADNVSKEYDGNTHTWDEIQRSLKYEDDVEITATASVDNITTAGSIDVTLSSAETDLFEAAAKTVTFTITQKALTITAKDHEKTYDGTALTVNVPDNLSELSDIDNDLYEVSENGLGNGDTVSGLTISGSQLIVGSSAAIPSQAVIKHGETDVTASYAISYANGNLTVTKRSITIKATNHTKVYNGEAITYSGKYTSNNLYTISGNGLALGDEIESFVLSGNQRVVGKSDIIIGDLAITNGNVDCTDNYTVTYEKGTLTITKATITLTATDIEKVYDGTPLTYEGKDFDELRDAYSITGIISGDTVADLTFTGTITNVGTTTFNPSDIKILRGNEDVTDTYDVVYVPGELKVTRRSLIVKVDDKSSIYGDEIENLTYTVTSGTEISDNDAGIVLKTNVNAGSDVGVYTITASSDNNNYDIEFTNGNYTIVARTITITSASESAKYVPGIAIANDSYSITEGSLAKGNILSSVTVRGIQTTVGSSANAVSEAIVKNGSIDVSHNYDITYIPGTLTVEKGMQEIIAEDLNINYDGKSHTWDEIRSHLRYEDTNTIKAIADSESITLAGEIEVTLTADETDLFEAASKTVKVTVTKRAITITADSGQKKYDGRAFKLESWKITEGELAEGDVVEEGSVLVKADNKNGSITNAGSVVNKISGEAIIKNGDVDVTNCYDITYKDGKLTVKAAKEKSEDNSEEDENSDPDNDPDNNSNEDPESGEPPRDDPQPSSDPSEKTPTPNPDFNPAPEDNSEPERNREPDQEGDSSTEPDNSSEPESDKSVAQDDEDKIDYSKFIVGTVKSEEAAEVISSQSNNNVVVVPEQEAESDIVDCEVVSADIEKMVDELLTEEEKETVSNGTNIRFRVELNRDEEDTVKDVKENVTKSISSNSSILGIFDTSLFVKIGDEEEKLIEQEYSSVEVTFKIPDELWDESLIGNAQILRTYTDEDGVLVTEVAVSEITDQTVVMYADNYSYYSLVSESAVLTEEEDCYIHWIILLMLILSVCKVIIFYHGKKKKTRKANENQTLEYRDGKNKNKEKKTTHYLILVVLNGIGAVLVVFGSCGWDIIAEIASIIVTIIFEAAASHRYKKYKKKLQTESVKDREIYSRCVDKN
nr:hypothetical protein [Butyrivibrio sp.]